ncbi:MAG: DUF1015 domain-containing protein [Candidatus Thermoplasmatota archaeon]
MTVLQPFRAIRFAPGTDLASITTPPHDCFTLAERDAFLARHPHNVARLVRGAELPGDGEGPGPPSWHARAADTLRGWLADRTLRQDASPALYLYTITHGPVDRRRTLTALIGRIAVDPSGVRVKPHEATLLRPRKDRLRLREATGCDLEPIWMLYRDPRGWINEIATSNAIDELARFTDDEGREHRLWRVERPEAVGELVAQFEERTLVIADGHHRYQTALEDAKRDPRRGAILTMLVRDDDPGLAIEATHRLVAALPFDAASIFQQLPAWEVHPVADPLAGLAALSPDGREVVLVTRAGAWRLRLRPEAELARGLGRLDTLAVSRVQERVLAPWGLLAGDERVRFTRDAAEAVAAVRSGQAAAAFLMPPESPAAVLDVAASGQLMPPKATYFVPKPRSGVVMAPA